jgi:phosphoenolpyruvate---glycerone phosphotransferase subunit DhaL
MVTRDQIVRWLERLAGVLEENREYLTRLDSAIGDADHGTNMDRGFKKVLAQLPSVADKDIGAILKTTGMALISSVGGAAGPLYGSFFMRASMALANKQELSTEDAGLLLQSGMEGIVQRGRAERGDKTILDALGPAVEAYQEAAAEGAATATALRRAAEAAEEGMQATVPMLARKGRASYLGQRSVGHQDPGATSTHLMIRTLADVVAEGAPG